MNVFETDKLRGVDVSHARDLKHDTKGFLKSNFSGTEIDRVDALQRSFGPEPPQNLAAIGVESIRPSIRAPYIREVEVDCEECGGSGFDPGGIDPWGPRYVQNAAVQKRKESRGTTWPRHSRSLPILTAHVRSNGSI